MFFAVFAAAAPIAAATSLPEAKGEGEYTVSTASMPTSATSASSAAVHWAGLRSGGSASGLSGGTPVRISPASFCAVSGPSRARVPPRFQQRAGGDAAQAPAVADDGEALAAQRTHARHGLGGIEQVFQGVDADPAGAAQRGFIDIVVAKGAGFSGAAVEVRAVHRHHGFVARRRARRRHELAARRRRFELDQDGFGLRILGQPVKYVGEVDVKAGTQVHHGGKADTLARRVIQSRRRDGRRLHHQRDFATPRHHRCDAGVKAAGGNQQAAASGTEHPHQRRPCGVEDGLARLCFLGFAQLLVQRRPDDHRPRAARSQFGDDFRHITQRCADDGEVGHRGQLGHMDPGADAEQGLLPRPRVQDRPLEAAAFEVAGHHVGIAAGLVALGDDGNRARAEQVIEVADGHGVRAEGGRW
jgi:hypothetical protein